MFCSMIRLGINLEPVLLTKNMGYIQSSMHPGPEILPMAEA
jgi:hypothetical protein